VNGDQRVTREGRTDARPAVQKRTCFRPSRAGDEIAASNLWGVYAFCYPLPGTPTPRAEAFHRYPEAQPRSGAEAEAEARP
jgi:hypothetical protein